MSLRDAAWKVLLVTPGVRLARGASETSRVAALERHAHEGFERGATGVLLREPDLDAQCLVSLARSIGRAGPVVVVDRVDVALAAMAAGVHLKGDGPTPARVRALLPRGMTLSRAVHDADEAAQHGGDPALDWLLAGTVFSSASKPGKAPLGVEGFGAIARASRLPVVAIGGIRADATAGLRAAGAAGIAGIGMFLPGFGRDGD